MTHRLDQTAEVVLISHFRVSADQVQSNPDATFADDPTESFSSKYFSHTTTYRFSSKTDTIGFY